MHNMLYMSNMWNMKIYEYYVYDKLYEPPPFGMTNMQNNMTQYAKFDKNLQKKACMKRM